MALIRRVRRGSVPKPRIHGTETDCEVSTYDLDGTIYVQLTSRGSDTRQNRGAPSQTMQFDERTAKQLRELLDTMLATK